MKFNNNPVRVALQKLLGSVVAFCLLSGQADAQNIRILKGDGVEQPACIALLRPQESTQGQSDVVLRLISQTGTDLTIAPVDSSQITKVELVSGDMRLPIRARKVTSRDQLEALPAWKAIGANQRFHLTANMKDGRIKSSRFAPIGGDTIVQEMARRCGLALPQSADQGFTVAADLTETDMRLALWSLRRLMGGHSLYPALPAEFSSGDLANLRAFKGDNGVNEPLSLDTQTVADLTKAAGISIRPEFDEARAFSKSGAPVRRGGFWEVIDASGASVTRPIFSDAIAGQDAGIPVSVYGRWIGFSPRGGRIPGFLHENLSNCAQNWCIAQSSGGVAFVSLAMREAKTQTFEHAVPFSDGLAFGREGRIWHSVSLDGRAVPWVGRMNAVKDHWADRAMVQRINQGKWSSWTLDRQPLATDFADEVWPATEGLYRFRKGRLFGFISGIDGTVVIAPTFTGLDGFSSGLAPAKRGEKWGYIDKAGRWIIKPAFAKAWPFSQALAVVRDARGRYGLIGTDGKSVLAPQFEDIGPFKEGRAAVRIDGLWGYLDRRRLLKTRP